MRIESLTYMSDAVLRVACLVLLFGTSLYAQEEAESENLSDLEIQVQNYRQSLAQIQGGYDPDSIELLTDLATALDELEQFDEAADVYEQALQSLRIRDGLYSESQLALLELAIDSAIANRDWELVDRNFNIAISILDQTIPLTDDDYEKWVRWYTSFTIAAQRHGLELSEDRSALENALAHYGLLQGKLQADDPDYLKKQIAYTREKSLAHYFNALAISAIPYDEFDSQAPETITGQRCYTIMRNGQPVTVCNNTQVPNPDYFESRQQSKAHAVQRQIDAIIESYRQLITTLENHPHAKVESLAEAVLELGDLQFMLRNTQDARANYRRYHQILADAGLAETVGAELSGVATEIISNLFDESSATIEFHESEPSGLVSFDVTEAGTVRNLGIIGQNADLEADNQELIAERLRMSVYRPRLEAGAPVSSRLERIPAAEL